MRKSSPAASRHIRTYRRGLVALVVLGVGAYVLLPQLNDFDDAWKALSQADPKWLLVALGGLLASYVLAAAIYRCLSQQPLRFGRTIVVQMAGMFAGRLLPAGVGALGVNYLYLRRERHTAAQAAAVVATNNVIGFLGNILLLASLFITGTHLPGWHVPQFRQWFLLGLLSVIAGLVLVRHTRLVQRAQAGLLASLQTITAYRHHPVRLLLALIFSLLLTGLYTLMLYASAHAIGSPLAFGAAVIIMSVGVAGASVTPTPGGLGGAEAALVAALALYHIETSTAIAIALLYRLFTFWLGLLLGGLALIVARRRDYL